MPKQNLPWKVSTAKRLIGVAQKKGLIIGGLEVGPDGTVRIHTADSAATAGVTGLPANEWDEVLPSGKIAEIS